jgi:hypothetical protein
MPAGTTHLLAFACDYLCGNMHLRLTSQIILAAYDITVKRIIKIVVLLDVWKNQGGMARRRSRISDIYRKLLLDRLMGEQIAETYAWGSKSLKHMRGGANR